MSKCPDNYWWDININVSFLTCREVMVTEEPVLSWFQNFRNFTNLFQSFPFWMENWSDFPSWENRFSLNFLSCHCDKDILTNCGEKKETWLYCNGHLMYLSIFSLLLLVFLSSCKLYFSYIDIHDRWWKIWKKVIGGSGAWWVVGSWRKSHSDILSWDHPDCLWACQKARQRLKWFNRKKYNISKVCKYQITKM